MLRVVVLLAALASAAPAQLALDTFTGGVNQGGWTFGANSAVAGSGGNPGACLRTTNLDTFAPQLHTQGSSGFTGNWRAKGVDSVGVDLITVSTQFPFQRECTLMLSNGASTIYYLGTDFVPQLGTGWKSFEFLADAGSTTMPPGWFVLGPGNPNTAWNSVITNVTSITFFYGDPTFFFIFDIWNIGADNLRLSFSPVWNDKGFALAGASGTPSLSGSGQLVGGSLTKLHVAGTAPSAPAALIVGFVSIHAPFKGGTLVPSPGVIVNLVTSPTGTLDVAATWPTDLPQGSSFDAQAWIVDSTGPKGFAATNGVMAISR